MSLVIDVLCLLLGVVIGATVTMPHVRDAARRLADTNARLTGANERAVAMAAQIRQMAAHLKHRGRMLSYARSKRVGAFSLLGMRAPDAAETKRITKPLLLRSHPDHGGDADLLRLVLAVRERALKEATESRT